MLLATSLEAHSRSARICSCPCREVGPALVVHRNRRAWSQEVHSSTASAPLIVYLSGPVIGNRTRPRWRIAVPTSSRPRRGVPGRRGPCRPRSTGLRAPDPPTSARSRSPPRRSGGFRVAVSAWGGRHRDRRPAGAVEWISQAQGRAHRRPDGAPRRVVMTAPLGGGERGRRRRGCRRAGRGSAAPHRWPELGPGWPARGLARRRAPAEPVGPAGGVERRIGEDPPPLHLDQRWSALRCG